MTFPGKRSTMFVSSTPVLSGYLSLVERARGSLLTRSHGRAAIPFPLSHGHLVGSWTPYSSGVQAGADTDSLVLSTVAAPGESFVSVRVCVTQSSAAPMVAKLVRVMTPAGSQPLLETVVAQRADGVRQTGSPDFILLTSRNLQFGESMDVKDNHFYRLVLEVGATGDVFHSADSVREKKI